MSSGGGENVTTVPELSTPCSTSGASAVLTWVFIFTNSCPAWHMRLVVNGFSPEDAEWLPGGPLSLQESPASESTVAAPVSYLPLDADLRGPSAQTEGSSSVWGAPLCG